MVDGGHVLASVAAADLPSLCDLQFHGFHSCDGPLDPAPLLLHHRHTSALNGAAQLSLGALSSTVSLPRLQSLSLNCGDASRHDPCGLLAEINLEALMALPESSITSLSIKLPLQVS